MTRKKVLALRPTQFGQGVTIGPEPAATGPAGGRGPSWLESAVRGHGPEIETAERGLVTSGLAGQGSRNAGCFGAPIAQRRLQAEERTESPAFQRSTRLRDRGRTRRVHSLLERSA